MADLSKPGPEKERRRHRSRSLDEAELASAESDVSSTFTRVRGRSNSILKHRVDPSYQPKYLNKFGSIECSIDDITGVNKVLVLHTGGTIGMKVNKDGVYVPLDVNSFVPELKKIPIFHDNESDYELPDESLIITRSNGPPIVYTIYEYDPLLDSCNMTMDDWKMLAKDIERNYRRFDGFVILHGTDTMAYTASALAFMLENLGKPVILTGAQIPIFEPRTDGRDNFLGALFIAGHYFIPEVCLYFNDTLLRGCRATKIDSENFAAFASPNSPPLATVGIDIKIHWQNVFKPYIAEQFCISTEMSQHVGVLRLFPSISAQTVHLFLQPPMQGVVIQSYGAGNGPSARRDLFKEFQEATDRGVIIVNITQCSHGAVTLSYETGAALADTGIISGADMTPEAALTKLSYVLGKNVSLEEKKMMMETNLRGELRSAKEENIALSTHALIERVAQAMMVSSGDEVATIRDVLFPSMMCDAAQKGNIKSLQELVNTGGTLSNPSDYDGRTPLHVASSAGKLDTVHFLLQNGASVHVRDRYGDTALMNAIHFGHEDITKLLIKAGAHLNLPKLKLGSFLCIAASEERLDQLRCWHIAEVDLNAVNREGRSALHVAASIGSMEVVEWLLEQDLDLGVLDNQGLMAVELAENAGEMEVAARLRKAMLESSSNSSTKDSAASTQTSR